MDTERATFMQTLARFAGMKSDSQPLRSKNFACVRTLIKLARDNANFLQGSWSTVLAVVSDIDRRRRPLSAGGPFVGAVGWLPGSW